MTNITPQTDTLSIANLFQVLSVQPRLEILLTIGESEACVCHLEAALGYRQAFISQHLMALREANILTSHREGRFIYYHLVDKRILNVLNIAGEFLGQPVTLLPIKLFSCECPNCSAKT